MVDSKDKAQIDLWNELATIEAKLHDLRDILDKPIKPHVQRQVAEEKWARITELRNMLAGWGMNVRLAAIRGHLGREK